MADESSLVLQSCIKRTLKLSRLKRGTLVGGAGALLLVLTGMWLPPTLLAKFGLPIFMAGISLIAIGFFPYRQLCQIEQRPHYLKIENHKLLFYQKERERFSLPLSLIEKVAFLEKEHLYGIAFHLKPCDKERFGNYAVEAAFLDYDLFLPYFTTQAASAIQAHV